MIESLNFGFLEDEDRLFVESVSRTEIVTFLMTRRLVRRFIGSTAKLLVNSNPMMPQTPFDNRKGVIILEHQLATQAAAPTPRPEAAETAADPAERPRRTALLHKIGIEVEPRFFTVTLSDTKDITATIAVSRAELHRVLATLHRLSQTAEWGLEQDSAWLSDVSADLVQPSSARC